MFMAAFAEIPLRLECSDLTVNLNSGKIQLPIFTRQNRKSSKCQTEYFVKTSPLFYYRSWWEFRYIFGERRGIINRQGNRKQNEQQALRRASAKKSDDEGTFISLSSEWLITQKSQEQLTGNRILWLPGTGYCGQPGAAGLVSLTSLAGLLAGWAAAALIAIGWFRWIGLIKGYPMYQDPFSSWHHCTVCTH